MRTRSRLLGPAPVDPMQIELVDTSGEPLTTLVYARPTPEAGTRRECEGVASTISMPLHWRAGAVRDFVP